MTEIGRFLAVENDPAQGKAAVAARSGCLFGGLLLAIGLCGVLVYFAWLREMPLFWRNAGGYPVELRDLVEVSFYPLSLAAIAGLLILGWALCVKGGRRSPTVWLVQMLMLGLCIMLLIAAAAIAFTNNVVNLWNGYPLHSHPEERMEKP